MKSGGDHVKQDKLGIFTIQWNDSVGLCVLFNGWLIIVGLVVFCGIVESNNRRLGIVGVIIKLVVVVGEMMGV